MKQQNMNDMSQTVGVFQHKKIIEDLEKQGKNVIVFPKVLTNEIEFEVKGLEIVSNLSKFDWIIFTDIYAVDFFIKKLEENSIDLFELDNLRVCAYGEAVADRLRFVQIHSDVIAFDVDETNTFRQIDEYLFQESKFSELKFLLVKEKGREFHIKNLLNESGSDVYELKVYQTEIIENLTRLKTLAKGGAFDELVFFSPDDVCDLAKIFMNENVLEVFNETKFFAKNEATFQALREFGFRPKLRP